jgi:insulysin
VLGALSLLLTMSVDAPIDRYANFFLGQPYEHARYAQSQLLTLTKWHMKEYLDVIGPLTLPDLKLFTSGLLSRLKLTMLVGGNLREVDARTAATVVESTLAPLSLTPAQIPRARAIKLDPSSNRVYHFKGHNENEDNGATVMYYECMHRNTRCSVSLDLLVQIANKPAFEILRTQQQLGYIVFTYKEQHQGVAGLGFIVQSNVKSPAVVDRRVEGFLVKLRQLLIDMDDEEWESHIAAVVTAKTEPDKRLSQEINRAWEEIVSKQASVNFKRRHVQAAAVQTITKPELISFFDKFIGQAAPQRSKLAIHTVSAKFAEEYERNPEGNEEEEASENAGEAAGEGTEDTEAAGSASESLVGPLLEVTRIPEDGVAAWKAGMEVHPATGADDDGLTVPSY